MHTMELQFIDLEQSGDKLIARGKYVMNNKQDEIIDIGKFMAIYKKEKNAWRYKRICLIRLWKHGHRLKYLII